MATTGGVTQAIFPEGGLTLTGAVRPAKLGLLSYVVEGWKPGGRDVVFVPVAINYDRVLEDRVLIGAAMRGDRRFGASKRSVTRAALRIVWQRLIGRFQRFGNAAVVFAEPVRLSAYGEAPRLEDLGRDLMGRIEAAMPMLTVPLISRALLRAQAPMDEAALTDALQAMRAEGGANPGLITVGADDVALACKALARRGATRQGDAGWTATEDGKPLLAYYAASVAHLLPEEDAAPASHFSAPAGS